MWKILFFYILFPYSHFTISLCIFLVFFVIQFFSPQVSFLWLNHLSIGYNLLQNDNWKMEDPNAKGEENRWL